MVNGFIHFDSPHQDRRIGSPDIFIIQTLANTANQREVAAGWPPNLGAFPAGSSQTRGCTGLLMTSLISPGRL